MGHGDMWATSQLFGVGAFLAGDLSEMRFLLGCEVEFHRLQSTE